MFRLMPPHLMALVVLLILMIWVMLVHHFRRSTTIQKFVSQALGDDTPESALLAYEVAKARLEDHLSTGDLDDAMRRRIELALGTSQPGEVIDSQTANRSF